MSTQLKRVNVINSVSGIAYRATRYRASMLVNNEGFHHTTKSKLKSLLKAQEKRNKQQEAHKNITREQFINESRNRRRPFKYRFADMVKNYFNKKEVTN